jgi:V/A-type H+-transporting ATPase subunit C
MTGKGFGYAYTNTRVRVMKSRLIDPLEYSKLLKMSLDQIARYLQETDYKKEIDEMGTTYEEANLIEYAINRNLANSFKKILNFSLKDSRQTIRLFLKKYDIWNIKTILRGKQAKETEEEIIQNLIPAGELNEEFLVDVTKKAASVEEAIKFFKKTSFYETLKKHSANLTELEDALDIEYHNSRVKKTTGKIKEIFEEKAVYLDALNEARAKETKIQMKNILEEKKRKKIVVEDVKKSRIDMRQRMSEKGRKMVHIFKRDSSPVIGYFIAKENEVNNLRILARGKQANLPLELIEQQLVY